MGMLHELTFSTSLAGPLKRIRSYGTTTNGTLLVNTPLGVVTVT